MAWFTIELATGERYETMLEDRARMLVRTNRDNIARFTIDGEEIDPERWAPRSPMTAADVREVFKPLPPEEAEAMYEVLGDQWDPQRYAEEQRGKLAAIRPEALARAFHHQIRSVLTPHELHYVDAENAKGPSNICATHDFCDANVYMDAALAEFGFAVDPANEFHSAIMNAAWDMAKNHGFAKEWAE